MNSNAQINLCDYRDSEIIHSEASACFRPENLSLFEVKKNFLPQIGTKECKPMNLRKAFYYVFEQFISVIQF